MVVLAAGGGYYYYDNVYSQPQESVEETIKSTRVRQGDPVAWGELAAGILLFIAWLVAMALRFLVEKGGSLFKVDERLSKYAALKEEEQVTFTSSLATAVYWFTLLLFLPSVLTALGIQQIAAPIQTVFNQIFDYIPNVLAAGVILLVGWFIARVIR